MSAPLPSLGQATSSGDHLAPQAEIVYHLLTDPQLARCGRSAGSGLSAADRARLIDLLQDPPSSTEKLREIEALGQCGKPAPGTGGPFLVRCLLAITAPHALMAQQRLAGAAQPAGQPPGLAPTVPVAQYRPWRDIVNWVDEELLAALAVAAWACQSAPSQRADLIWQQCLWPTFLRPADRDYQDLLDGGVEDAHVHFGELTPAVVTWRELVDEQWVPTKACSDALGLAELKIQARAARQELWSQSGLWRARRVWQELARYQWPLEVPRRQRPPGALLRHYLRPERYLLSYCLAALLGQHHTPAGGGAGPTLGSQAADAFWRYVRQRCLFWRRLGPSQPGFEAFVKEEQLDGEYLRKELHGRLIVDFLADSRVERLDVRCVVKPGTAGIKPAHQQRIRQYAGYHDEYAQPAAVPLAFLAVGSHLKGKAHAANGRAFGVREAPGWRGLRRRVLDWTRQTIRKGRVAGLDMIQSEYGFDPGIVAPAYRLTAGQRLCWPGGERQETVFAATTGDRLTRYYHTGEDVDHPITAARNADQAIDWLGLGPRDRLGHLTALAQQPACYTVRETVGERLDNLLWLAQPADPTPDVAQWRRELGDLCDDTYREQTRRPRIADLTAASRWLPLLEPDEAAPSDELAWLVYLSICSFDDAPFQRNAQPWLLEVAAQAKRCRLRRQEWITGDYSAAAMQSALDRLQHKVLQSGVLIETCPTSNLVIGSRHQAAVPGARLAASQLQGCLVIGTDDPSMLLTDLPAELALAASQLLHDQPETPRGEIFARLQRLAGQ
ncbi:MAG: hypothetical protein IT204_17720 [Fimbriimonadaceae bacterium]|nr:hypothetical protein [Fimbriimonadaceae bacterium]